MPIELLYIVPALALAVFIVILVFHFQKNPSGTENIQRGDTRSMPVQKSTEARLGEFESTILSINTALTDQQRIIEQFQSGAGVGNVELESMRSKLRDLHKEYDIVISENYSLRAKVKSMQKKNDVAEKPVEKVEPVSPPVSYPAREHSEMNMNLYEDTRLYKTSTLDDTKEIDLAELR